MDNKEISEKVEDWYKAKEKAAFYEKEAEKLKKKIINHMIQEQLDSIKTVNFSVTKKSISRESLSKKDVPDDIWKKYSKEISYDTYTIKER